MSDQHRSQSRREAEVTLTPTQFCLLLPAAAVAAVGVIASVASVMGLPGGNVATDFLRDAFGLLISTLVYVVAIITVPAIVCALSDSVGTKLCMSAFTASVFIFLPRVLPWIAQLLDMAGCPTTVLPVLTTPLGVRFAIRPQPSLPALRFSPGASPQLE